MLGALFERIEAHVIVPEPFVRKLRTKRDADAVARLLAERGHEVEWVRRNYGAQRQLTWNVRLANGAEIHNTGQLEELGLSLPQDDVPARGGVKVVAFPGRGGAASSNTCHWSGRRDSNPLPQPWEGRALPGELLPRR